MTAIQTYDDKRIPKALVDENPYHPSADVYVQTLKKIQNAIMVQTRNVKDKKVVIAAKLYHRGTSFADIAQEVARTPVWVAKHLKLKPAQDLIALLAYYEEMVDGSTEAQRRAMLWRIAVKNEDVAPKISHGVITELNKMAGIGKEAIAGVNIGALNIQINNNLSRGALD